MTFDMSLQEESLLPNTDVSLQNGNESSVGGVYHCEQ